MQQHVPASFVVTFAALAITVRAHRDWLATDPEFCAALAGADRQATVSVGDLLATLLDKATSIETIPFNPMGSTSPDSIAQGIQSAAKTFITTIQACEQGGASLFSADRAVSGLLAMARSFPDLERKIEVVVAEQALVASGAPRPNLVPRAMFDSARLTPAAASSERASSGGGKRRGKGA